MGDDWDDEAGCVSVGIRNVSIHNAVRPARGRGRSGALGKLSEAPVGAWRNGASAPPPPGGRSGDDGKCDGKEVVEVESCYVGRLIGTKGATRRDMEERSGCRININQKDRSDPTASVELVGSKEAIDKAKEIIEELTGSAGPRTEGGRGGGGGGGGRDCFKCGQAGVS